MSKHESIVREVIGGMGNTARLAEFAIDRHGFGNTDGGFGVTYPSDAKQFDEEDLIPEGSVQIYGFWGPPEGYELLVTEVEYLQILTSVLYESGLSEQAKKVEGLIEGSLPRRIG